MMGTSSSHTFLLVFRQAATGIIVCRMSLPRTSKDLNSCPLPSFLPSPLRNNLDTSINPFQIQITQLTLSKNSSQKNLPKKSSQESSKKTLQKILKKNKKKSRKNPKNFQKISQKVMKISNSLHHTWRPKTLSGLFKSKFQELS